MSDQDSAAKRAWVERVLGLKVGGGAVASPVFDSATLTKRLGELARRVTAIGSPKDLMEDLRSIGAALKGGQLGMTADLLDETAGRLASRERAGDAAADIAKAAPSKAVGVVAFAKMRMKWAATRQAREEAINTLHALCAKVLADPQAQEDPQYEDMQQAAADIGDRMPDFGSGVDDALDAMVNAQGEQRDAARKAVLDEIGKIRADLDREPALKLLQDTEAGKFAIYDSVAGALSELEAAVNG
jgi:hypothetical protein